MPYTNPLKVIFKSGTTISEIVNKLIYNESKIFE